MSSGGVEEVASGGSLNSVTVLSGGDLIVDSGGTAANVVVSSGGAETLTLSASKARTLISGQAGADITLDIVGGGSATLNAADSGIVRVNLQATGAGSSPYVFTADGEAGLVVDDLNTQADTINLGGVGQTVTGGAGSITANLSTSGHDTVSDATSLLNGVTIGNFATAANVIDLTDLVANSTVAKFTENAAGTAGVLSLNDGSHSASITLLGQFMAAGFSGSAAAAGFSITPDGATGTKVTYTPVAAPHG